MKILSTIPFTESEKARIRSLAPEAEFRFASDADLAPEALKDVDVLLGNVPPKWLMRGKRLRFVQLSSAGSDAYAAPGVLPPGAVLCNASGAYGLAISEYMLAGLFSLLKKLEPYAENRKARRWASLGAVGAVEGSRTLAVGLGDIGGEFARKMHALGSTVTGIRRTESALPPYLSALYHLDALDDLLPEMDFVALSLPNSPDTRHVLGARQFERMKPTAIVLNVGRGTAVDTDALCAALCAGRIGGAVIDVTDPEPLPPEHPLWAAPNLVLTPHISGGYHLPETRRRVAEIALKNLEAFLTGQPLKNPVDPHTGYRRA